jgi:hypothetical protein
VRGILHTTYIFSIICRIFSIFFSKLAPPARFNETNTAKRFPGCSRTGRTAKTGQKKYKKIAVSLPHKRTTTTVQPHSKSSKSSSWIGGNFSSTLAM